MIYHLNFKDRGKILDRNGYILATTIQNNNLILNPSIFKNPQKIISSLNKVFSETIKKDTSYNISENQKYFKVKTNIAPSKYKEILKLGIPGIKLEKSYFRKYPANNVASHIIGKVDPDGNGVSGLELSMNKRLANGDNINTIRHVKCMW